MRRFLQSSVNLLPASARHWIKHIPGVAAGQRWLVNRVLSGQPFVHVINAGPARGLHFEVVLPCDKAVWAGTYEAEFSAALRQGVRPGDVCYDIGGYRGYMAGVFALAGASAVVVFEPLPANIKALMRLIELNPDRPLRLERTAIGNTDGAVMFRIMPDSSMGKLAHSPFQAGLCAEEVITVPIARLDTLLAERRVPPPNVVKIDVEGAEVDVLRGASRILREFRPRLFIEAHSAALADESSQILSQYGYSVRQMESGIVPPELARHLLAEPV